MTSINYDVLNFEGETIKTISLENIQCEQIPQWIVFRKENNFRKCGQHDLGNCANCVHTIYKGGWIRCVYQILGDNKFKPITNFNYTICDKFKNWEYKL